MELFELQNNIIRKTLPKFLIFVGNEYAIGNIYIQKIATALNKKITPIDDLSTIAANSKVISLVGVDKLYINKYDKSFITKEKLWEDLDKKLRDNFLIIVLSDVDKRSKFYKNFQDRIVDFSEQDTKTLSKMLGAYTTLTKDNIEKLIMACGNNYGKCMLEIDKIIAYSKNHQGTHDEIFEVLVKQRAINVDNTDVLFEFINCVLQRKKSCMVLYNRLKTEGESNIKLLSMLYTEFKNQLIIQTVKTLTQDATGLTPYILNKCIHRKGIYTDEELQTNLREVVKLEQGVKSGWIEEPFVIDYLLARII